MSPHTYEVRRPPQVIVLEALRRLADAEGYVVISNKKLRNYLGIAEGSVFLGIKRLREDGYIAWVAGGGSHPAQIRVLEPGDDIAAVTAELERRAAAAHATPSEPRAPYKLAATGKPREVTAEARRYQSPLPPSPLLRDLERLARLKRQGYLSDAEFEQAKRRLLGL